MNQPAGPYRRRGVEDELLFGGLQRGVKTQQHPATGRGGELRVTPRGIAHSRKGVDQCVDFVQAAHEDENVAALIHVCSVIRSDS